MGSLYADKVKEEISKPVFTCEGCNWWFYAGEIKQSVMVTEICGGCNLEKECHSTLLADLPSRHYRGNCGGGERRSFNRGNS